MKSDLSRFAARLRALIDDSRVEPRINFAELALELFALQFEANPAYRKICEVRRATPLTVSDWTQIPAVPTAAFKELELTCLPPEQRTHAFHSSGTTQQKPSRHFHSTESLSLYDDLLWAWFSQHVTKGIKRPNPLLLTPPPRQSRHSSLVHMFATVRQKLGAGAIEFAGGVGSNGAWTLNLDSVTQQLEAASNKSEPILILGTAFSFVHLLDHLSEANRKFRLPPGSRVMETGGYKGRSREMPKLELHALISKHFGVPPHHIICEYGMSELSSQAYDTPTEARRTFHFPPWARVQIISPETGREVSEGETGLIRVFDLANVFSVMAVQTEDLAARRGDGFELLGRVATSEPRGCSLMAV